MNPDNPMRFKKNSTIEYQAFGGPRNWAEINPKAVTFLEIPKELLDKPRSVILEYFANEFPDRDKYYFPGDTYFNLLSEGLVSIPDVIKDKENRHFFIGSQLENRHKESFFAFSWEGGELVPEISSGVPLLRPIDRVLVLPRELK